MVELGEKTIKMFFLQRENWKQYFTLKIIILFFLPDLKNLFSVNLANFCKFSLIACFFLLSNLTAGFKSNVHSHI